MKKFFTLLVFTFAITFADAQRKCDLQVSPFLPGNGWIIQNGKPFDITVKVKNLGPDAIKTTDTILYLLKIDGTYITSSGQPLGKALIGLSIPVGTEVTQSLFTGLTMTFTIDGSHQFCTEATLFNRAAVDGASDVSLSNNTGCATVLMNKFTSGINAKSDLLINGISVFPNPVHSITTLNYVVDGENDVKIAIKDLQGREVLQVLNELQNAGNYEKTIDLSSFSNGIYLVEYNVGGKVYTSKIIKN